jgi:hypothetical protein
VTKRENSAPYLDFSIVVARIRAGCGLPGDFAETGQDP